MAAVCCELRHVSLKTVLNQLYMYTNTVFIRNSKKDKSKNFLINYSTFTTPQIRAKSPGNVVAAAVL